MKIVIIDNYDSFTYNLSHLVKELGAEVTVLRNDQFQLYYNYPKSKKNKTQVHAIPSLPVCFNNYKKHNQAIGEVFGGKLENLSDVFHGVATEGTQFGNDEIFSGLPSRITMGRYHSWVVSKEDFPDCIEITAESDEGQIMALRHKTLNIRGIQFHPESVLTPDGRKMLQNWLFL